MVPPLSCPQKGLVSRRSTPLSSGVRQQHAVPLARARKKTSLSADRKRDVHDSIMAQRLLSYISSYMACKAASSMVAQRASISGPWS